MVRWFATALVLSVSLVACTERDGPTVVRPAHSITVDGTLSLPQLAARGNIDDVSNDINVTNFPILQNTRHDEIMTVVFFNRHISSDDAVRDMQARNLRPANLDECLAYGAAAESARQAFSLGPLEGAIACLGQSATLKNGRMVPEISDDGETLHIDLFNWISDWNKGDSFLAVRI